MTKKVCSTCDGTGWIFALMSMFIADGYYKLRCGICGGSGHHALHVGPSDYRKFQATARERVREWRGLKPPQARGTGEAAS